MKVLGLTLVGQPRGTASSPIMNGNVDAAMRSNSLKLSGCISEELEDFTVTVGPGPEKTVTVATSLTPGMFGVGDGVAKTVAGPVKPQYLLYIESAAVMGVGPPQVVYSVARQLVRNDDPMLRRSSAHRQESCFDLSHPTAATRLL